ncbi:MAG: DinB family protein [Umezawaea sp.]
MKADLHEYLVMAREAVLWKVDGLSGYDVRRPVTSTGTNLLGLVKHLTTVEVIYFGVAFGRMPAQPPPWVGREAEHNADKWATAEESREYIVDTYRKACLHSDTTIGALELDAPAFVPWWAEEHRRTTLHRVLVHVIAECHRHTGHADVVRELVDGEVGEQREDAFMPPVDRAWWAEYVDRLERVAKEAVA